MSTFWEAMRSEIVNDKAAFDKLKVASNLRLIMQYLKKKVSIHNRINLVVQQTVY
jgi:hypothetical protein